MAVTVIEPKNFVNSIESVSAEVIYATHTTSVI